MSTPTLIDNSDNQRIATWVRNTAETQIEMTLNLDGSGKSSIDTGHAFLDHMLTLLTLHGSFDLTLKAVGDLEVDAHHTVEDVAIVLGELIRIALGDKIGITRYGHAYIPMDETLTRVVIDLGNRPYLTFIAAEDTPSPANLPFSLVEEFFRALSNHLRSNIHAEVFYGRDGHHIVESLFKSLARALRVAVHQDPFMQGKLPSTKELL